MLKNTVSEELPARLDDIEPILLPGLEVLLPWFSVSMEEVNGSVGISHRVRNRPVRSIGDRDNGLRVGVGWKESKI